MLKKNKILLISGAAVVATAGVVAGTAIGLTQKTKANDSSLVDGRVDGLIPVAPDTTSPSGLGIKITNTSTVRTMSSSGEESAQTQYTLSIEMSQEVSEKGTLTFVNEQGQDLGKTTTVIAGQKVFVKMTVMSQEDTLLDLWIYDSTNPNVSLGSQKEGEDGMYSFVMPEEGSEFYKNGEIKVKPTFGKKQFNKWTYDYASRTYAYHVTADNFVFDDIQDGELKLVGSETGSRQYKIFLDGHSISIKNLTVPENAQLMFVGNSDKEPVVSLATGGKVEIKGALGRYRDVKYTTEFHYTVTGSPTLASQLSKEEKEKLV